MSVIRLRRATSSEALIDEINWAEISITLALICATLVRKRGRVRSDYLLVGAKRRIAEAIELATDTLLVSKSEMLPAISVLLADDVIQLLPRRPGKPCTELGLVEKVMSENYRDSIAVTKRRPGRPPKLPLELDRVIAKSVDTQILVGWIPSARRREGSVTGAIEQLIRKNKEINRQLVQLPQDKVRAERRNGARRLLRRYNRGKFVPGSK